MVLILAIVEDDEATKVENKGKRYQLTTFAGPTAVYYDTRQPPPEPEAVKEARQDTSTDASAGSFFLMPFDGIMDASVEEGASSSSEEWNTLEVLMSDVSSRVASRENVTIINRGVNAEKFLEKVLRVIQKAVERSAENAMHIVADGIAKEKQMQRLLQLENEVNKPHSRDVVRKLADGDKNTKATIRLSAKLTRSLKALVKEHKFLLGPRGKATERFTILTATHRGELIPPCTKGSCLGCRSPYQAAHSRFDSATTSLRRLREGGRSSQQSARLKRKSTLIALENLESDVNQEPIRPLKGNGWGDEMQYFVFDGASSFIALPGIPKFEDVIKSFKVDFWFKKNPEWTAPKATLIHIDDGRLDVGQLFEISWVQREDVSEGICIYIRDGTNRVLDCLLPVALNQSPGGTTSFHHFVLHVQSLEESKLNCIFDGTVVQLTIVQQENPIFFNAWPHRLYVGGHLDETNAVRNVFSGSICEVRFGVQDVDGYRPLVRWPLMASDEKQQEMTRTIPPEQLGMLKGVEPGCGPPPSCAPHLDGNLVVNLGTLGILGDLLHNWTVEIRFKTDVDNRVMSLLGVTDKQCRMQGFGIVFNAEPAFGRERYRFHEYNITLYLVDSLGACCSALLRGNEHTNFMDGQWHTLVWKCIDSEANAYSVKVDGTPQELFYLVREGPGKFIPFDDWICLGGHNVRSYRVQCPFYGEISRCFISARGVPLATLVMNEGPGSYVLQDSSGRCNHGLLISEKTCAIRRHDVFWYPYLEETHEEGQDTTAQDEVFIHMNNAVSLAAVVFTCEFSQSGVVREVPYDVLAGASVELRVVEQHICDARPEWKTWRALPESCFRHVETLVQFEEIVNEALSLEKPVGHFMFVIRIGDCHVTLLNLHGPVLPPDATFNQSMLRWQYAYAVAGTKGRREIMLNHMINSVDSVLLSDTLKPFTTWKLGPITVSGKSIVTEDLVRSLQNSGKPWLLSAVLHNHLLNAEFGSSLHIIHHISGRATADEAASIALFNRRLYIATYERAAVLIQRNWRAQMGRMEALRLANEKQVQERRVEEIAVLRANPLLKARERLSALLISLHDIEAESIPSINDNLEELSSMLRRQGYEVTHLLNPERVAITKSIAELDQNATSFVYVSGYGGRMEIRQPILVSLHSLHISISEGSQRAHIDLERGLGYRQMIQNFRETMPQPKARKSKKKQVVIMSKKATQEAEMAARQRDEMFRWAVAETEDEEANLRMACEAEYDTEVLMIIREIKLAIESTEEYERLYRQNEAGMNFILPCENLFVNPYANTLCEVGELMQLIFQRHMTPVGLQRVVAFDLEPITPMTCGFACLASSTGNTLRFPYKPQQRRVFTDILKKAFDGRLPRVSAHTKAAILRGGIETTAEQRDWRSLATYVVSQMQSVVDEETYAAARKELDRELPFTAELIPIHTCPLDSDARDKLRRERDSKEVHVVMRFAVGSAVVQPDMFSVFKNILVQAGPLKEILFKRTIYFVLTQNNKGIDGIVMEAVESEVEKCRPQECNVGIRLTACAAGVRVNFEDDDPAQKQNITHWVNAIVMRCLSWRLPVNPLFGYRTLDVDHVAYLYEVKCTCSVRKFRRLQKQQHKEPIPIPYVRFMECEIATAS
ncbi:hypothetical protein, conserved [Trypanosoma brucei gambiense DAL972]|uniref:Uncharacterized protein n=2 Tax=Trypanosoma brucei TaxID=5691 RepID=D0A9Q6_TRYB9|nr:hypothetical protein, conserved [Trypanosoma brucei gambiense DAL972]RHW68423.1 hypothetical protein DPX39_110114600 [Trypanosoma brucei equiperdum]CBH18407.1 hypothetical protein, conserved [Trypanosoma brucei gambiense DAL972]|eukprot:XP_011780671.1 hypothetical protein, conserved [Trypanosoma brucei gambiense DAL972]